jgi:site-specific recombinase XerC
MTDTPDTTPHLPAPATPVKRPKRPPRRSRGEIAAAKVGIANAKGLYLVTNSRTGNQSFYYRYRSPLTGKNANLHIGTADFNAPSAHVVAGPAMGAVLNAHDAALLARQCRAAVARGSDPAIEHKAFEKRTTEALAADVSGSPQVAALFKAFMAGYPMRPGGIARPTTQKHVGALLGLKPDGRWIKDRCDSWAETGGGVLAQWKGKPIGAIRKADAFALVDAMATHAPVQANRLLSALQLFGKWAVERDYIETNFFRDVSKQGQEQKRSRYLSDSEIRALVVATDAAPEGSKQRFWGEFAQWLLLTGQRPGTNTTGARVECLWARWDDIDIAGAVWANGQTKTIAQTVPLSAQALALLERLPSRDASPLLFPQPGNPRHARWAQTVKSSGLLAAMRKADRSVKPFVWHDLRRTVFTGIERSHSSDIADRVVGHAKGGMAGVYGHYDFAAEKREALEAWGQHVARIAKAESR